MAHDPTVVHDWHEHPVTATLLRRLQEDVQTAQLELESAAAISTDGKVLGAVEKLRVLRNMLREMKEGKL